MEYIHRLPFILGASMSIIVGIVSFEYRLSQQATYIRMAICMIIFFILGILVRNTLVKTIEDVEKKREEREIQIMQEEDRMLAVAEAAKNITNRQPSILDYKTPDSDYGEDFSPLTVSEIIKRKTDFK